MAWRYTHEHQVAFSETDMAGIVHFSNVFRIMEAAEHAFFRSLGFSVVMDIEGVHYGWPRVHATCDYFHPLHFEDVVSVKLMVRNMTGKSIEYGFNLSVGDKKIAQGVVNTVCVEKNDVGQMKAVAIPEPIRNAIKVAPAEMLDD